MNFICEKKSLYTAIISALAAVSKKSTLQVIEGLLLTANKDDGTLVLCGYDLEKGVKVTISGENLQIIESGNIIINAEKFSSVIKSMPDGDVSITVDTNFIMDIKSNKVEFEIHGVDGKTFPSLPELKGEKNFKLPRKTLRYMIASTLFSVATNNPKPVLNGALFELKNNRLNVVSTDGCRLAMRRSSEGLTANEELDLRFIIPHKSLAELLRLIGEAGDSAELELTKKHVIVSFDNIIFFSRLIEGEYFNYNHAIQTAPKTTVVMETRSFVESLERAAVLTDDRQKNNITLNFKKEDLTIENRDEAGIVQITSESSSGKTFDECGIEIYGDDLEIGFNQRYLYEALKAIKEEKILMKLESAVKSLIILPYNKEKDIDIHDSTFLYLVSPMRIRSK